MALDLNKTDFAKTLAYSALIISGLFIIYLLSDFITPFLGAVIFFVLGKPWVDRLVKRGWKKGYAAFIVILLSLFVILLPMLSLSYMLYSKAAEIIHDPSSLVGIGELLDQKLQALTGVEFFTAENFQSLQQKAANLIPSFLGEIFMITGNIFIMYFMLYYMLVSGDSMTSEVNNFLPFRREHVKLLADELNNMTMSNVVGVPLIGVVQGVAAGIGYWVFGLSEPVFWAAITAFVSFIPFVGTAMVWIPAGMFLLITGEPWQGVCLLIYGALLVTNIDNVVRFVIQKKFADVHPLITVFGVIIGLNLFGLPGLIFGPLMLSYFLIFIKMYRKVYRTDEVVILPGPDMNA